MAARPAAPKPGRSLARAASGAGPATKPKPASGAARPGPAGPALSQPKRWQAEVVRITLARRQLTGAALPVLHELFGLKALPLAPTDVAVELRGVPTAAVNALRRVLLDEMPGHALMADFATGFDPVATTERAMLPEFVQGRLAHIPLRARLPPGADRLRFRLEAANPTASVVPVYAGDLRVEAGAMPEPLFNPTFRLLELQPGTRFVFGGIRIAEGLGRDNAAFSVARRAAYRHLDLAQRDEKETHDRPDGDAVGPPRKGEPGCAADESGYADADGNALSCLVADPRHHLLSFVLPATGPDPAEAHAVLAAACGNVVDRLRFVEAVVGSAGSGAPEAPEPAVGGARYVVVPLADGLAEGVLQVPGETHTIGELLRRAVVDLTPDLAFVQYTIPSHEAGLRFSLRHAGDVTRVLAGAVHHCIEAYTELRRAVEAEAPR